MPFELQLASALAHTIAGPTRFAAGVLAGAAALEAVLMASLSGYPQIGTDPLTALYVYGPAALAFYRLSLWGSLAALVGAACDMLIRSKGNHYFIHPWRPYLDALLLVLFSTIMWLTFAGRQMAFTLTSFRQKALTPHYGPTGNIAKYQLGLDYCSPIAAFDDLEDLWDAHASELIAKQVLTVLAAVLTFVPTCDECFAQPPPSQRVGIPGSTGSRAAIRPSEGAHVHMGAARHPGAAPGGGARWHAAYLHGGGYADSSEHVLGLASYIEGGVSLAVGFWSQRMEIEQTHPLERAPDGTGQLLPLSLYEFPRRTYAGRVCLAMVFLTLDVLSNMLTDSFHWEDVSLDLYFSVALAVVPGLTRVLFFVPFMLLITSTEHFRLGLYAIIQRDFGGALLWGGVSFALSAILHSVRVLRAALSHSIDDNASSFFTSPWGQMYSSVFGLNILLTGVFYIKALMAMRRLANSEYYMHPDRADQRERDMLQSELRAWVTGGF